MVLSIFEHFSIHKTYVSHLRPAFSGSTLHAVEACHVEIKRPLQPFRGELLHVQALFQEVLTPKIALFLCHKAETHKTNMKNKDQSAHTEEATQAGSNFHFLHPLQPHTGHPKHLLNLLGSLAHFSVGQIPRINLKKTPFLAESDLQTTRNKGLLLERIIGSVGILH